MQILKIEEASRICGVPGEVILTYIKEEWIVPQSMDVDSLDEEDIARIKLIHELKEVFGVNDEAIPIILNLLDQLNRLYIEVQQRL